MTWYLIGDGDRGGADARQAQALREAWQGDLLVPGPIAVAGGLRTRARDADEVVSEWDARMLAAARQAGLAPPVRGGWTVSRSWPSSCRSPVVVGGAHDELGRR